MSKCNSVQEKAHNALSHTLLHFNIKIYFFLNPAYGRHQLSRPMRIVGPMQIWRALHDLSFFLLFYRLHDFSQQKKFKKKYLYIDILINHATSSNLYRSYYPHRSRELVSPVCGIFSEHFPPMSGTLFFFWQIWENK